jgi:hypothetical protein
VLLFTFVVAAMRHWTELPWHEVLGALAGPVLGVHLWLNWNWILDVLRRRALTLRGEVRFNRAWDVAQSGVTLVAVGSGLVVSRHLLPALGLNPPRNRFVEDIHAVSAWCLMVMIGIHLGVHGHWVWSKVRKPRFALAGVLGALIVGALAGLGILRQSGLFSGRFRGDAISVGAAVVPATLIAFGTLAVIRRRRPVGAVKVVAIEPQP